MSVSNVQPWLVFPLPNCFDVFRHLFLKCLKKKCVICHWFVILYIVNFCCFLLCDVTCTHIGRRVSCRVEQQKALLRDIAFSFFLFVCFTRSLRYFCKSDVEMKPPVQWVTREKEKLDSGMWSESHSLVMDVLRSCCGFIPEGNEGSQGGNGTALASWLGGDAGSVPLHLKLTAS